MYVCCQIPQPTWDVCGVCHVPEEFVVQEVVGEEELQKQIITGAPCGCQQGANTLPAKYHQGTSKVKRQGLLGRQDWQERLCRQACSVGRRVDG